MTRLKHDDPDLVYACPECDKGGSVYERSGTNTSVGDPDAPYICQKCTATFGEPVEREAKTGGRAPKYADLTPEDLGL